MGQMQLQVDETGVNQLFIKLFNALGDQPYAISQSAHAGGAGISLKLSTRAQAVDLGSSARPLNLRGGGANPPLRFEGLRFKLPCQVELVVQVAGWERKGEARFQVEATLNGGAQIGLRERATDFLVQLSLQPDGLSLSLAGNRQAVVDAAKKTLDGIDTNPWMPGTQGLPANLVNAVADAAGKAYDALSGPAAEGMAALLRTRLADLRMDVSQPVDKLIRLEVPDLGPINVALGLPQITMFDDRVLISASFS